jgi:uncharacterized membrane protein
MAGSEVDAGRDGGGLDLSTERLEAFSDGVMAVVITLMALELKVPISASFQALRHQLPELLVYLLSFVNIGIYWNNHHHLLRVTPKIGPAVMWANLHLLFWLSLLPLLTAWVGEEYRRSLPAAAYGVVAMMAAVAYWLLVRSIVRTNAGSRVATAIGDDRKGVASIGLYVAGVALSALTPYAGYGFYVLVAGVWFIPDPRLAG